MSDLIQIREPKNGNDWRCQRCDHQWRSRRVGDPKPTACANCRSAYWDKPPKQKKEKADKAARGTGAVRRIGSKRRKRSGKPRGVKLPTASLDEQRKAIATLRSDLPMTVLVDRMDDAENVLPPPPHLRRAYHSPESAPMPENLIGRKDANGTKTTKDTE